MNPSIARNPAAESKKALRQHAIGSTGYKPLRAGAQYRARAAPAGCVKAVRCRMRRILLAARRRVRRARRDRGLARGKTRDARRVCRWSRSAARRSNFTHGRPHTPMKIGHHEIAEPHVGARCDSPTAVRAVRGFRRARLPARLRRRLLRSHAGCVAGARPSRSTVGIAYEACRAPALLREAHDIPLDADRHRGSALPAPGGLSVRRASLGARAPYSEQSLRYKDAAARAAVS